jgi:glutathione peroxidase-family protein
VSYTQFTTLQQRYYSQGLRILGFPCNQFGNQEPGNATSIKALAEKYGVIQAGGTWFSKIKVNGADSLPLFKWLEKKGIPSTVLWNFEKWVLDRNGNIKQRFRTTTDPIKMEPLLISLLNNQTLADE